MKKGIWIIVALIIIILIILGVAYSMEMNRNKVKTGSLIISVTDATANINNVSDVHLRLSGVELHQKNGAWITVSKKEETYALISLNQSGKTRLYAQEVVPSGTYDQVRVNIKSAVVITKDGAEHTATLPSETITIAGNVIIDPNATSSLKFDFLADKSLHKTEDGRFVFAPVVTLKARKDADVQINSLNHMITKVEGNVTAETTVGVDVDGNSKANWGIAPDAKLKIVGNHIEVIPQTIEGPGPTEGSGTATTSTTLSAGAAASGTISHTGGTTSVDASATATVKTLIGN